MIITKKYIFTLIALFAATTLAAQDGTTAYNFLSVTPSTHVYGLGGHNVSLIDDDINLVELNPALMGPEIDKQIGLNYMRYMGESNFMGARYGMKINAHSAWAAGIQYFGYGSMTAADPDGTITGTFSAHDIAFTGTYSHDITNRLRGGINVKVISSSYEIYSACAIAVDLGLSYFDATHDLSLGLVVANLGGQVKKFNETYNRLPWDIRMGITKGIGHSPFRASVTLHSLSKWHLPYYSKHSLVAADDLVKKDSFGTNLFRHLTFGLEYAPTERLYIGLGYDHKTRTDMSNYSRNFLSGFSLCGGLKVRGFGFGVAFAQPHSGATSFMVNLNTSLSELLH